MRAEGSELREHWRHNTRFLSIFAAAPKASPQGNPRTSRTDTRKRLSPLTPPPAPRRPSPRSLGRPRPPPPAILSGEHAAFRETACSALTFERDFSCVPSLSRGKSPCERVVDSARTRPGFGRGMGSRVRMCAKVGEHLAPSLAGSGLSSPGLDSWEARC